MCFDQKSSFAFAGMGLFGAWWIHSKTNNFELASGVFFFFTMEFLQGLQYFVIADDLNDKWCDTFVNQFLTVLGFLHICCQPYFCHVINASLTKSPKYLGYYKIIKRLCVMGGSCLFLRFVLGWVISTGRFQMTDEITQLTMISNTMDVSFPAGAVTGKSTEWLRGERLCTFNGKYHLAWSIPMADPSYYIPGSAIHSFLMYAPFFALYEKKGMVIQGVFLFMTGPVLASWISPNLMEQASIWCFFSISQICSMLFLIRETLLLHWGKESKPKHHGSLLRKKEGKTNDKSDGKTTK